MGSTTKVINAYNCEVEARRRGRHGEYIAEIRRGGKTIHATCRCKGKGAALDALNRALDWCRKKFASKCKTIKLSELKQLSFCNSTKLPPRVTINGSTREWTGIGWLDLEEFDPKVPVVIDG